MINRNEPSTLEFFCKLNSETVIYCDWKDSKYCQKSCKYYRTIPQESGKEEDIYLLKQ